MDFRRIVKTSFSKQTAERADWPADVICPVEDEPR